MESTLLRAGVVWAVIGAGTACGQPVVPGVVVGEEQPAVRPAGVVTSVKPPEPGASIAGYNAVEAWVRAFAVPEAPAAIAGLEAMGGAAVTLRLEQRVVGRGVSFRPGQAGLVEAAKLAMADAGPRLEVPNDALVEENRRAVAQQLKVSVELAGPLVPLAVASFAEVDAVLQPGLDGVAARFEDKTAGVFPAAMLVMNLPPSDALAAAISEASGDPTIAVKTDPRGQPGIVAREHKGQFYKFKTVQVAQLGVGKPPVFLWRGGKVVDSSAVTRESMREFADVLARNLCGRIDRQSPDLKVMGTVVPFQARVEQSSASTVEKLLTAAAIAKQVKVTKNSKLTAGFNHLPHEIRASVGEAEIVGPIEAAAWVIASREIERLPQPSMYSQGMSVGYSSEPFRFVDSLADGNTDFVDAKSPADPTKPDEPKRSEEPNEPVEPSGPEKVAALKRGFEQWVEKVKVDPAVQARIGAMVASAYDPETGWVAGVPESGKAFIAYALAIEAKAAGLDAAEVAVRRSRADAAITSIYKDTAPARLVSQMPWLGLAELMLAEEGKEIPSAVALREMRDLVWKHQLTVDDGGVDGQDLVGGIVFTSSSNPLPTWQSVRPVVFLAAMARDPRLSNEQESLRSVGKLLDAVRFLRQLSIDEYSGYAAVEPEMSMGGVRSSLWDQRQPVEATALTLWAVCEVLETLDELAKK